MESELLLSPTDDMGKILSSLHGVPLKGCSMGKESMNLVNAIQVSHLALKHRRNKNGGQRVVAFVGSPINEDNSSLTKAGRLLKKNNVAIDVICMGENQVNQEKLKTLVEAANGTAGDNCHLVTIPEGVLPSDVLVSSPIMQGAGMAAEMAAAASSGTSGGGGADAFAEFGGIDPNLDPELALALRVSMEEERARQERAAAAAATSPEENENSNDSATAAASSSEAQDDSKMEVEEGPVENPVADLEADEDALLQQALAMSMNDVPDSGSNINTAGEDEDEEMKLALQMSMQIESSQEKPQKGDAESSDASTGQFQDPQFLNQIIGSLPGVDPNDPQIQEALKNMNKDGEKKDAKEEATDDIDAMKA